MAFDSRVLQLSIPTPFSVGSVNIHAVKGLEGYYLIDAGIVTDEARKLIFQWLPGPLSGILLTHAHPDHLGLAGELAKAMSCPVYMNFDEYQRSQDPQFRPRVMALLMEKAGVPNDVILEVAEDYQKSIQPYYKPLADAKVRKLMPGQKFYTELGPMEVLDTPGHSVGHSCFYLSETKVLFSGDHILSSVLANPLLDVKGDGKRRLAYVEYLQSVDKIASLSIERVYPGHGASFDNWKKVINRFHIFHLRREKITLAAVSNQLKTPFEIARKIYPGVRGYGIFLSLSRVWGQLDFLVQQGKVFGVEKANAAYYCLR